MSYSDMGDGMAWIIRMLIAISIFFAAGVILLGGTVVFLIFWMIR